MSDVNTTAATVAETATEIITEATKGDRTALLKLAGIGAGGFVLGVVTTKIAGAIRRRSLTKRLLDKAGSVTDPVQTVRQAADNLANAAEAAADSAANTAAAVVASGAAAAAEAVAKPGNKGNKPATTAGDAAS